MIPRSAKYSSSMPNQVSQPVNLFFRWKIWVLTETFQELGFHRSSFLSACTSLFRLSLAEITHSSQSNTSANTNLRLSKQSFCSSSNLILHSSSQRGFHGCIVITTTWRWYGIWRHYVCASWSRRWRVPCVRAVGGLSADCWKVGLVHWIRRGGLTPTNSTSLGKGRVRRSDSSRHPRAGTWVNAMISQAILAKQFSYVINVLDWGLPKLNMHRS